jgi:YgiT-type zinc finger domain-containing protein
MKSCNHSVEKSIPRRRRGHPLRTGSQAGARKPALPYVEFSYPDILIDATGIWSYSAGEETPFMKCHVCGSSLKSLITDLPLKISEATIVILKGLPVLQCENCGEYLLEDAVMERVEQMMKKVNAAAELEIIRYAA